MSGEQGGAKAWVLAFVLMAGVGLGGFIGIGCLVGANTCPGKSRATIRSTNGREIYVRANCAGCHGRDGAGGRGPSLVSGPLGELTPNELVPKIKKGKPLGGMPRFRDELSEAQIRAVAEYVVSLRDAA